MTTPSTSYTELLKQHAALEQQIAMVREAEVGAAIKQARALIDEFGLTQADVFQPPSQSVKETRAPLDIVTRSVVAPGQDGAGSRSGSRARILRGSKFNRAYAKNAPRAVVQRRSSDLNLICVARVEKKAP